MGAVHKNQLITCVVALLGKSDLRTYSNYSEEKMILEIVTINLGGLLGYGANCYLIKTDSDIF
jgi:hypothetical protein